MADINASSVAFTLKRATGEIEIRAATPERVRQEMDKHAVEHVFDDIVRHHDALHGVTGRKKV